MSGERPSRGEVWWVELGPRRGSAPPGRRPAVVVSADRYNASRIATVVIAAVTSNTALARAPGNVLIAAGSAELDRESVINVTQLATLDRRALVARSGVLDGASLVALDAGLRLVLDL